MGKKFETQYAILRHKEKDCSAPFGISCQKSQDWSDEMCVQETGV